jgi:hypothetical protein
MTQELDRLTRKDAIEALAIPPEALERLESMGWVSADADGTFAVLELASAAIRYGLERANGANLKLVQVGESLRDVKPALERLAVLADKADLKGDEHHRVMVEVAAFFTTFAGVMNRATAALQADEDGAAPDA